MSDKTTPQYFINNILLQSRNKDCLKITKNGEEIIHLEVNLFRRTLDGTKYCIGATNKVEVELIPNSTNISKKIERGDVNVIFY